LEKDEVIFAFNMILVQKRAGSASDVMKIPIVVNTGKLKLN